MILTVPRRIKIRKAIKRLRFPHLTLECCLFGTEHIPRLPSSVETKRMKKLIVLPGLFAALLVASVFAFAQEKGEHGQQSHAQQPQAHAQQPKGNAQHGGGEHGVGNGHIPAHGPAPSHAAPARQPHDNHAAPPHEEKPPTYRDQEGHPEAPHVHADNDRWIGHEGHDPRYRLDHPWEHGHFSGPIGARHAWRLSGGDPHRFGFGGFFFEVAEPDIVYCNDWLWDSDDIILYDDPDDPGYYLAYNVRLGTYVHVVFLGS
jgi:hypothetical protein